MAATQPKPSSNPPALPDDEAASPVSSASLSLELRASIMPILRWWWLILLVTGLSASIAFLVVKNYYVVYYQARSTVGIGVPVGQMTSPAPLLTNLRLGYSYSKMITFDGFLAQVAQKSGSELSPVDIRERLVVFFVNSTPFISTQIIDSDPNRALKTLETINLLLTSEAEEAKLLRNALQKQAIVARQSELVSLVDSKTRDLEDLDSGRGVEGETSGKNIQIDSQSSSLRTQLIDFKDELSELKRYTSTDNPNQLYVLEKPFLVPTKLGAQPREAAIALGFISFILTTLLVLIQNRLEGKILSREEVERVAGTDVTLQLSKDGNRNRLMFEALAAELYDHYYRHEEMRRLNLLLLYEDHTRDAMLAADKLAQSLNDIGVQITVRVEDISFSFDDYETRLDLPRWELVIMRGTPELSYKRVALQNCQAALLLCSLSRSRRGTINFLQDILTRAKVSLYGVIVL